VPTEQYHEPPAELSEETRTFARICTSLIEEAEAINWYEQRLSVEKDKTARAIMEDAQGEEFKHFGMDLEFLLRRSPRWRETLDANLTATFLTARGFLRQLEGAGSLVLVGSTAGLYGEAGHADYAAAKSAILHGLLLSLKNEVVRLDPGARVNAVAPGWTESAMTRGLVDEERVRAISRTMALRKVAQPEDVARQVVALASDELSGHVTGQIVTVAGGMEGRVVHET
jgi:hypothetical protein